MTTRNITSRLLYERGRIEFHYPNKAGTIVFVPFYENPEIKESQSANYADYNPIGRPGSLYAYTGAESRKFKIKATYTLPHLAQHQYGILNFLRLMEKTDQQKKAEFTQNPPVWAAGHETDAETSVSYAGSKRYYDLLRTEKGAWFSGILGLDLSLETALKKMRAANPEDAHILRIPPMDEKDKIIDTLLFFMEVFRTSTVNNVEDPVLGPPLLRLDFGTLYRSVPCVCKSYNLSWEEDVGYDLDTLTPRRLIISLQLEEIRAGNFGKFDPGHIISRDNLAGWESVIGGPDSQSVPYTMDPTNTVFNRSPK